ncbi:MAG: family 2 glycosyl transferase [Candidatus Nomurabacteria bacterium GW2011_GWE1_32_28]|uniref:Family 2 glycosyl transferase n=1 Tax=Candidatus Nomurabacteria bacterium GW2011_GWF1_31_48 TaxID=1618767 RepID=A0A0F9YF73_9BACT|nr:MAG: family 2 glycosyl transferase [Candidatus Nomurabacteria bacterium GW2011_GWF2_30_133]KKP28762.1 MAG: family 2 glycosyl transferase [Candidatus Nomurabacteria bacterium GW2011_GWE2_31_40]KKP30339.1 MAG: family 2 glycosyl transferase [Candidatus Nomurabacteria bacterium GW2011_GWF1_31_48]KKP34866.1 MAG: family 2 glycosyl transferase [Candidatus Nomurabacteria bacterium GW2011_GWE1_32_28]HAS80959.1 hypothetical protein [Candidatus Nomurabacteria bacterium]
MEKEKDFKISLIIPAYNEEKYIGLCLDSVLKNSNGKIFEIIVVDNNSTDKTIEIVKRYKEIKIIKEEKKGAIRARQKGFLESKGDILAFIDADTKMLPNWTQQIIDEFKKDKNLVCLSGPYVYYDISTWKSFLVKFFWIISIPVYWIMGYMAIFGNLVIKKEILEKMNGFDTNIDFFGDDTNTARRAKAFGKVKFKLNFKMQTSGRRLIHSGILKTTIIYVYYFFSESIKHKIINKKYKDIR